MTATKETAPGQSVVGRIDALDVVKGLLVVFMVVYHSMNRSAYHPYAFRLMSFLPPSFIMITGFLLMQVYLPRFAPQPWVLTKRLWLRGAKLLALFTALNLVIQLALGHGDLDRLQAFFETWQTIYVIGDYRLSAFDVLLPIAYVLILSPLLLLAQLRQKLALPLSAGGLAIFCWVLEQRGVLPGNLAMMSFGVLGAAIGAVPLRQIERLARPVFVLVPLWLMCRWVNFHYVGFYLLQMADVGVSLLLFYGLAMRMNPSHTGFKGLALLGCYSLLAYVAQIGFLFGFILLVGHRVSSPSGLALLILGTFVLTWLAAWLSDYSRARSAVSEKAYRLVFA